MFIHWSHGVWCRRVRWAVGLATEERFILKGRSWKFLPRATESHHLASASPSGGPLPPNGPGAAGGGPADRPTPGFRRPNSSMIWLAVILGGVLAIVIYNNSTVSRTEVSYDFFRTQVDHDQVAEVEFNQQQATGKFRHPLIVKSAESAAVTAKRPSISLPALNPAPRSSPISKSRFPLPIVIPKACSINCTRTRR